jgi:hypothetical protein
MQAGQPREFRQARRIHPDSQQVIYAMFARADAVDANADRASDGMISEANTVAGSGSGTHRSRHRFRALLLAPR